MADDVKLEWKRASADHSGTCQPCQRSTNRIVAFRQPGDPRFDAMFLCDDCLEGIQTLFSRRPAEG